jgi:phage terminase large subunit-like protein
MPFSTASISRYDLRMIRKGRRSEDDACQAAIEARTDFAKFREYVCNHESPKHHKRWFEILNTGEDSKCLHGIGGPNTLILSPRGSAKSTMLVEWAAYQIGQHACPRVRIPLKIMYVSYSIEVALLKSEQIQSILMDPKYQEVFPWVRPGNKWGSRLWDIDKEIAGMSLTSEPYTLACAGLKGVVVSKRSMLVLLDDLLKSPDQIENPIIREKMEGNWTNAIRPTMYEGARAVCLGTRMGSEDIYATAFTEERGWSVIEESAIIEEGNEEVSYWPEMHSIVHLQGLRDDDPSSFALQYQNTIPKDSLGVIDPEWWIEGPCPLIEEMESVVIGSDFSASKREGSDYTVFCLIGRKDGKYYLLDMRRGRWQGNIDKCNALVGLLLDWGFIETDTSYYTSNDGVVAFDLSQGPVKIQQNDLYVTLFAEGQSYQVSFQSDYAGYIQNELGIWNVSVIPVAPKGDKMQRLKGVTGIFQRKQVVVNKYCPTFKVLRRELLNFGFTKRDDTVDAMVYGLAGLGIRPNVDAA